MLAIRMQRTGRKGHANFRIVVQDSRLTPTSGKVVAQLGSYDPHTKIATLTKDKADFYLKNGARPSERVALLLKKEGIKLPAWVEINQKKEGKLRNPEKLRKNRPAGTEAPAKPEANQEEQPAALVEPASEASEAPAEEKVATEEISLVADAEPQPSTPAETDSTAETPAED